MTRAPQRAPQRTRRTPQTSLLRRILPRSDERGYAGGVETVPFGILVFVAGTMLMVNLWAVVDAHVTLDAAARDYLRAYTGAVDRDGALDAGTEALRRSIGERWTDIEVSAPPEPFGPCRPATVRIEVTIDSVRLPFVGTIGSHTISSTQSELVQPYRGAVDEHPGLPPTVCDQ
ncbi:MAG: hypothetical protein M9952_09220 [Microthrixaceae bacterium]|nr:hypothetical protein [Microthrixaceae bacterium]